MRTRLSTIWVVARRDLTTRARSKAYRISTAIMLVALVLGIVLPTVLMRGTGTYTVAVADSGSGMPIAVAAQAKAAGVTVTVRQTSDRAAAVALVDDGTATAALAQVSIAQRAQGLGLTPAQLGSLFAPTAPTITRLHPTRARDRRPWSPWQG